MPIPTSSCRAIALPVSRPDISATIGSSTSPSVRTLAAAVSEKAANQNAEDKAPVRPAPRLPRHSRSDPAKAARSRSASQMPSSKLWIVMARTSTVSERITKSPCVSAPVAPRKAIAERPNSAPAITPVRIMRVSPSNCPNSPGFTEAIKTPAVTRITANQANSGNWSPSNATPSKATITGSVLI